MSTANNTTGGSGDNTSSAAQTGIMVIQITDDVPIVCGPSHFDLAIALAYAFNKANPHRAIFHLGVVSLGKFTETISAQVIGLDYESGEEGMFLIKLNFRYRGRDVQASGYYDARRQKGYLKIPR